MPWVLAWRLRGPRLARSVGRILTVLYVPTVPGFFKDGGDCRKVWSGMAPVTPAGVLLELAGGLTGFRVEGDVAT